MAVLHGRIHSASLSFSSYNASAFLCFSNGASCCKKYCGSRHPICIIQSKSGVPPLRGIESPLFLLLLLFLLLAANRSFLLFQRLRPLDHLPSRVVPPLPFVHPLPPLTFLPLQILLVNLVALLLQRSVVVAENHPFGILPQLLVVILQYDARRVGIQFPAQIGRGRYPPVPRHGLGGGPGRRLLGRVPLVPQHHLGVPPAPTPHLAEQSQSEQAGDFGLLALRAVLVQGKAQHDVRGPFAQDAVHYRRREVGGVESREDGEGAGTVPSHRDRHSRADQSVVDADGAEGGETTPSSGLVVVAVGGGGVHGV
mmetsp:Transcript_56172/g.119451  ORF Transcript_56172/g.119451 Transcript_56172/m.119451 type:complete len:311 (+) Transcript_56172:209-1141(+)